MIFIYKHCLDYFNIPNELIARIGELWFEDRRIELGALLTFPSINYQPYWGYASANTEKHCWRIWYLGPKNIVMTEELHMYTVLKKGKYTYQEEYIDTVHKIYTPHGEPTDLLLNPRDTSYP